MNKSKHYWKTNSLSIWRKNYLMSSKQKQLCPDKAGHVRLHPSSGADQLYPRAIRRHSIHQEWPQYQQVLQVTTRLNSADYTSIQLVPYLDWTTCSYFNMNSYVL